MNLKMASVSSSCPFCCRSFAAIALRAMTGGSMPIGEDDFEDAREVGIDPENARRAHRMFTRWHDVIKEEFPEALDGDPEQIDIVMTGAAALWGEMMGMVWLESTEELARQVFQLKCDFARAKMEHFAWEARGLT